MKLIPLDDRLLVTPVELITGKVGSLYIPDTAKEKITIGRVVAQGDDVRDRLVGKVLLYPPYAGLRVTIAGRGLIMLRRNEDAFAILEVEPGEIAEPTDQEK